MAAYEIDDHDLQLRLDVKPGADKPLCMDVVSGDAGMTFRLSVTGAERLYMALSSAITQAHRHRIY